MSALEMPHIDLEQRSRRHSFEGSGGTSFSDAEDGSCYSQFYSTTGGSYDDYSFEFACVFDPEILDGLIVDSDCSVEEETENGVGEIKVNLAKVEGERDCRICHLGLENNSDEYGVAIELGCSCKDDLAAAHKQCAEAWFKIKGNRTCEICQSIARNVVGVNETQIIEQANESNNVTTVTAISASLPHSETRSICHGHRIMNFLLVCMVFAFVISWLFHFKIPSS